MSDDEQLFFLHCRETRKGLNHHKSDLGKNFSTIFGKLVEIPSVKPFFFFFFFFFVRVLILCVDCQDSGNGCETEKKEKRLHCSFRLV